RSASAAALGSKGRARKALPATRAARTLRARRARPAPARRLPGQVCAALVTWRVATVLILAPSQVALEVRSPFEACRGTAARDLLPRDGHHIEHQWPPSTLPLPPVPPSTPALSTGRGAQVRSLLIGWFSHGPSW